jgi:AhpD family alkylhydroperoxidase
MGHTPEFLSANWPRSRLLYGGQPDDQDKSLSRLSLKEKHLVTLAVSAANNCEYCVRIHTSRLRQLGTTREELLEALAVAGAAGAFDRLAEGLRAGERPTVPPAVAPQPDVGLDDRDEVLDLLAHRPDLLEAHRGLARGAFDEEGRLGSRVKGMLAFAVAATDGADYYIRRHGRWLRKAGLDEEELVELLLIVDLTCGYNRYVQGLQVQPAPNT